MYKIKKEAGGVSNPLEAALALNGFCILGDVVNLDVCLSPFLGGVVDIHHTAATADERLSLEATHASVPVTYTNHRVSTSVAYHLFKGGGNGGGFSNISLCRNVSNDTFLEELINNRILNVQATGGLVLSSLNASTDVVAKPGNNVTMGEFIVRDPTGVLGQDELAIDHSGGVWNIVTTGVVNNRNITLNTNSGGQIGAITFALGSDGNLTLGKVGATFFLAPRAGFAGLCDLGNGIAEDWRNLNMSGLIRDSGGINAIEIETDSTVGGLYRRKLAADEVIGLAIDEVEITSTYFGDYLRNSVTAEYFMPRNAAQSDQTSGVLVTGAAYLIVTFIAGDDFANLGGDNSTGDLFISSGTTPTTWTNGSTVRRIGQDFPIGTEIEGVSTGGTTATFSADTDVTINDLLTVTNFTHWKLKKVATDEWDLVGS